jgi:diadenosine tetraphosphate (Ap4A) HIT family hydrolase
MMSDEQGQFVVGCFSCEQTAAGMHAPLRERIYDDGLWRVAHAFNSALAGWLVLLPRRHVTALADLTPAEAAALGPLLHRLSAALTSVTGCAKTYVLLLAEAQGFAHLHLHVIPRMADLPRERTGVRIFHYLDQPEAAWVSADEMDRIGAAVAEHLRRMEENEPRSV